MEAFEDLPATMREMLGEQEITASMAKNRCELLKVSNEEIEKLIELAKMPKKIEVVNKKTVKKFGNWSPAEAGLWLCFSPKMFLFAAITCCPDLMAKKIEEASKVYSDLPPVFLEFAKRWKEEKSR
jgi:hypothetical protein